MASGRATTSNAAHACQAPHAANCRRTTSPNTSRAAREPGRPSSCRSPDTTSRSPGASARRNPLTIHDSRRFMSAQLPCEAVAGADDRTIERRRLARPIRRALPHPLGSAAAQRRRISHPGGDQSLLLEPIDRRIERADRAPLPRGALDFLADRGAVGVAAQPRGRRQHQVFELAQHKFYIVEVINATVKRGAARRQAGSLSLCNELCCFQEDAKDTNHTSICVLTRLSSWLRAFVAALY